MNRQEYGQGLMNKRVNALIRHAFGVTPSPDLGGL